MGSEEKDKKRQEQFDKVNEKLVGGPKEERGCTDILCCLIFIAYMIFMCFLAIDGVSNGKPYELISAWDSSWSPCGRDLSDQEGGADLTEFKYIYFAIPHPDHLNKTTCVKECPSYFKEDLSDKPTELECNLHNNTMFEEFGCKEVCSPFSAASSSDTQDQGWGATSVAVNWNKLTCIYNTTVVGNRMCFPGEEIFKIVDSLTTAFSSSVNMDQLTSWMNDVDKGLAIIYASFAIVFVLGIIYMLFVRVFSGVIVWVIILLYFLLLALLGIYVHTRSLEVDQNIKDNNNVEYDNNTKDNRDTLLYCSYAIGIIWLICLIGLFCMWNNIRLAIAVIKTATIFTIQTPSAMFVPPVMALVTIVWWIIWIIFFVYVYAVGDVHKKSETSIFATVDHEQQQGYFVWCFIFGGLWVNAFFQALTQFILASTVSIWYWAQPDPCHKPVFRSLYRAFRYHLGSLAFGAFILAVVQTIRLMLEYVYRQSQAAGADKNKVTACILKCLRCCLACFERFIQFLTKTAYIQIALSGENFCTSAREGMTVVWANASRVSLCSGLGSAFIFIGKIFMIVFNVYICYMIYTNADPYKTEMNSTFLPLVIIFIFSWGISTIFMSVYGMAIDTILMCFLYDEKQNRGAEGKMRAPSTLKEFFGDHDRKVDDDKKRKEEKQKK